MSEIKKYEWNQIVSLGQDNPEFRKIVVDMVNAAGIENDELSPDALDNVVGGQLMYNSQNGNTVNTQPGHDNHASEQGFYNPKKMGNPGQQQHNSGGPNSNPDGT